MKITGKEVEKLANLVRLDLSESEREKYSHDLTSILDYVEKLNSVDTSGVKVDKEELLNVLSEDKAEPCEIKRGELLKNAPDTKDGYIKVKSVLE